jgi:hypothetical protein
LHRLKKLVGEPEEEVIRISDEVME